ncbi:MAG: NUDIX hydrolase [Pseudaminobacter sp.]|nr:NUDIX hydrolase [Pseudaminobacter sp.]
MMISYTTRNHFIDRIRLLFGGMPCRVQVAALPWRKSPDGVEVMLITSRDTGRWVIPKGWPEGQEDLFEAAAREAAEEAGLQGSVSRLEIGRYYYGKRQRSGMKARCEVLVFPLEIEQVADKWPERKKRKRKWFSPAEAAAAVRERDLAELISGFSPGRANSAA